MAGRSTVGVLLTEPGGGEALGVVGDVITVKLDREATGGVYSVFEQLTDPGGGPPPHRHVATELFYVLEGEVDFLQFPDEGGEPVNVVRGTPGAVVAIPSNAVHTYRTVGTKRSRLLFVCQPSGLEDFFRAVGVPVADPDNPPRPERPPDLAFILEAGRRHGVTFVGIEP